MEQVLLKGPNGSSVTPTKCQYIISNCCISMHRHLTWNDVKVPASITTNLSVIAIGSIRLASVPWCLLNAKILKLCNSDSERFGRWTKCLKNFLVWMYFQSNYSLFTSLWEILFHHCLMHCLFHRCHCRHKDYATKSSLRKHVIIIQ